MKNIMIIKDMIVKRAIEYCYINGIGITGYENILNNVIHEIDIQYLIAEDYFKNNKELMKSEMIEYERKDKTEKSN